jgi:hypothetical protein
MRADDHRPEELRLVGRHDDAHHGDRGDDGTALAVDHAATGVGDQDREQVQDDRVDERRDGLVGRPARGDEEGRDEAPGDERADVRHDHAGQEAAEALDARADSRSGDRGGEFGHEGRYSFVLSGESR